jgi:hypothetical protein
MADIPVQRPTLTGLNVAFVAAAAGDTFQNDGNVKLRVKNAAGVARVVTVVSGKPCSFGVIHAAHDSVTSVPAGGEREIGPFPRDRFNSNPSVTYDLTASVTVAVVE